MAPLGVVLREWGRIGCLGFGGPPAHIALLRELCVDRRGYLTAAEFEDAVAACNLLPGPASTQLAIFTAWRVGGPAGALVGGLAFVLPGLVAMVALAALFLADDPPAWIRGAGLGAGAAVAAVAVRTGASLVAPSRRRAGVSPRGDAAVAVRTGGSSVPASRRGAGVAARGDAGGGEAAGRAAGRRWLAYAVAGGAAAVLAGPWVVLALLGCGAAEVVRRAGPARGRGALGGAPLAAPAGGHTRLSTLGTLRPAAVFAAATSGGLGALAWVAFKVGALS